MTLTKCTIFMDDNKSLCYVMLWIFPRRPRKYKCKTVDVKALKTIVYSVISETNLSYTDTFISG